MNFKPLELDWQDAKSIDPLFLREQLAEASVLIVNNCEFKTKEEFSSWLSRMGPLEDFAYTKTQYEQVSTINNSDGINPVIFPQAGRTWNNMPTGDWHLDFIFKDPWPEYTCLYGQTIPNKLGNTWFADGHLALNSLSKVFADFLRTLQAIHYRQPKSRYTQKGWELEYFNNNLEGMGLRELQNVKAWFLTALQHSTKPVIQQDKFSREFICVSPSKCVHFEGMTEEESKPIIDFLEHHITLPEHIYQHQWKKDQLVIWTTARFNHYGVYDYHGYDRVLWRSYLK